MGYDNLKLEKGMYRQEGMNFTQVLESLDPSENYRGTALEGTDAFQRQLKRFGIRAKGAGSSPVEKFFRTMDSAVLFPEYIARTVRQGMEENDPLSSVVAALTFISATDYRGLTTDDDLEADVTAEAASLSATTISLKDKTTALKKRGRMMVASYEAIKFQRLDLFTVALKQIGACIGKAQLQDAVRVLMEGDGNHNPAQRVKLANAGQLTYTDLLNLWGSFGEYQMNVMLASPDMMLKILQIPELQNPETGLNFQATGCLTTPLGAKLFVSPAVPEGCIIGLDKRYALEKVQAGGIQVEYDKLIDCQLERAAVTAIAGFSKIFPEAVKVLGK